jgi:hypothetical protein
VQSPSRINKSTEFKFIHFPKVYLYEAEFSRYVGKKTKSCKRLDVATEMRIWPSAITPHFWKSFDEKNNTIPHTNKE